MASLRTEAHVLRIQPQEASWMNNVVYVLVYGVIFASLYGIMTVGFALICGLGGFYDITLPAYLMVGAFAIVKLYPYLSHWSLLVVAIGMGALCLGHYYIFIRPQRENPYTVFFATILLALGVESVMAIIFTYGYTFKLTPLFGGSVGFLGVGVRRELIFGGIVGWVSLFALNYLTSHTNIGRAIIAIPQSTRGSQVIGLDVVKIQMLVYFIGGVLLGVGAYFYGGYIGVSVHMWSYPLIIMFTITTLGGLGSIKGIMYATLLIGVLEVGVVTFVDPRIRAFVLLGAAVAILIYRPRGIAGIRIG
jgi:branched-chain amino acid transport system permease protein